MSRRAAAYALGIFAVALALRLVYLGEISEVPFVQFPINDARAYDVWGQEIAEGNWWGDEAFYQAPLYPYFLGTIYAVAGHSLSMVHVVQMVLGALACVLMFAVTRTLFGDVTGLVAGGLLAIYPPAIYFDGIIGKMTLGLALFVSLLLCLVHLQRRPSPALSAGAGVLLALLCLTRENALALFPAIVIWMLLRFRADPLPRRATWIVLFSAGMAMVLGGVAVRNLVVGDSFLVTTSQMGTNFYIGNNADANGLYTPLVPGRNTPTYEASDAANIAEQDLGRSLTRAEVSDYWLGRGLDFVREQPLAFLGLLLRKTLLTWNRFEIADTEDIYVYADWSLLMRSTLPWLHFGILAPLAMAGWALAWRRREDVWLFPWLALSYTAAVALFLAFGRFRYPLVPLLLPFAAFAIVRGVERVRARDWVALRTPAAVAVVTAVVTNVPLIDEASMRGASYTNLAGIMLNQRRETDAKPYLDRALALRPTSPDVQFHIAVYHFRLREFEEAEAALRRMIEFESDDVRGYRLLFALLRKQGRDDEAEVIRARIREVNPDRGARHLPREDGPRVVPPHRDPAGN